MFGPLAACAVTCAVAVTAAAALAASGHATVQPPVQPVAMGENIIWATAAAGTSALVQAWMRSPGHRANILSPGFDEIGIGLARRDNARGVYGGQDVVAGVTDFAG